MFHHLNNVEGSRPRYMKAILHACSLCRREGLRPGILDTSAGDHGVREWASQKFSDLVLDESGVCQRCQVSDYVHRTHPTQSP